MKYSVQKEVRPYPRFKALLHLVISLAALLVAAVATKVLSLPNKLLDGCYAGQRFVQLVSFSMIT